MYFYSFSAVIIVVLFPGVNLYFSFSSLSSPSFASCCWVRACWWRVCVWVVSSLCGVGARVLVLLLVPCACGSVFASVALFFVFPDYQPSLRLGRGLFCLVVVLASFLSVLFLFSLSLSLSFPAPCCASVGMPWVPWRNRY